MNAPLLEQLLKARKELNHIILGKERQVDLALCCLIANGHLLVEDLPGMGKTTLAHALSGVLGLDYKRVQFTSDLLPSDLLGASIYNDQTRRFEFHQGPVFSSLFLADELNRATPKAQSALLEGMEERQVSVEGQTYELPKPFFVIATQNPQSQYGTYPLPESQLDRFMLRLSLGYPDPEVERKIILGQKGRASLSALPTVLDHESLLKVQKLVPQVQMSEVLLDYIQRLIYQTRSPEYGQLGLSPRGGQALVRATQAWALLQQRGHALPDDVQAVFVAVAGHRLVGHQGMQGVNVAKRVLQSVDPIGQGTIPAAV